MGTRCTVPCQGVGFTRGQLQGGRGQWDRDRMASDSGPLGQKDRAAVLGSCRRGRAGRGAAAGVHVGVGVLDGRPVATLHGHHLRVGPGLLAAGALPLHGLGLRRVPGTHGSLRTRPAARPPVLASLGPGGGSSRSEHVGLCHPGLGWPVGTHGRFDRGPFPARHPLFPQPAQTPRTPPQDPALARGGQLATAWADLGRRALPAAPARDSGPRKALILPYPQMDTAPRPVDSGPKPQVPSRSPSWSSLALRRWTWRQGSPCGPPLCNFLGQTG